MFATFPALPESWLQGLNIYRGPRKRKYKKENSTEYCFTQGISDADEGFKTYRRNSPEGAECIHRYIYLYLYKGCIFLVQVKDFTVRHYTRSRLIDWTSEGWIEEKTAPKTHKLKTAACKRNLLYMQNKS